MAHSHQTEVDENFSVFTKLLPELLKSHPGKHAVMHSGRVVEFFDTISDAVRYGHAKFGDMNFSIQEVTTQHINLGYHSYALHDSAD